MKLFNVVLCCFILSAGLYASDFPYTYGSFFPSVVRQINPNTVDIRSLGMGNAEVAGDLGSNSIFSNPALLAVQKNGSIKLGSSLKFGFLKNDWLNAYGKANELDLKTEYKPILDFTNISVALPIQLKAASIPLSIAFGIGFQKRIDLSAKYFYKDEGSIKDPLDTIKYVFERTSKTTGGLYTTSPGISIGFFNRISAGCSINFGFSRVKIAEKLSTMTEKLNIQEATVVAGGSCIYPTFGVSGKPIESLCLGLTITPPFSWEISNAEVVESKTKLGGGAFTMPLKFSAGIEYHFNSLLTLTVEYQTRLFKSFKFDAERTTNLLLMNEYDFDSNLKNGHVLHVGAELMTGNVPFRTGFLLEPQAETAENGKPSYMFGVTLGSSIPVFKLVFVDIAAQYLTEKKAHVLQVQYYGLSYSKTRNIRIDIGVKINLPAVNTTSTN
jgi:hypothetical protein